MKLFTNIELICTEHGNQIFPYIKINGIQVISPGEIDKSVRSDFFLLEKYTIDRNDTEQMEALSNAVFYQSVLHYMSSYTYMSSFVYMGGYDIQTEPEYIDITEIFTLGKTGIIDTESDLTNNMYMYRIITYFDNEEHSSQYIAGIQHIDIINNASIDVSDEVLGLPPPSSGLGKMYRTDENDTIIVKGFPNMVFNPRYKGPIDGHKEVARQDNMSNTIETLNDILDNFEDKITSSFSDINDITCSIVEEIKF